jgi:hypothetical protein
MESGRGRLGRVTGARENREAGIFREARIGFGELAKEEVGAFGRFDGAGMAAIGTEPESLGERGIGMFGGHGILARGKSRREKAGNLP